MATIAFPLPDDAQVHTVWFRGWPGADWMAMVWRDGPDAPWQGRFRVRVHNPETTRAEERGERSVHQHRDKFHVYAVTGATRDVIIQRMDLLAATLPGDHPGEQAVRQVIDGTVHDFTTWIRAQPFCSTREVPFEKGVH